MFHIVLFLVLALLLGSPHILIALQQSTKPVPSTQSVFPGFLSGNARSANVFQSPGEIRKALPQSETASPDSIVLFASRSSSLGMNWGDTVEVNTLICDKETIELVQRSILDLLSEQHFQPIGYWDGRGFLRAERQGYRVIFTTPPPQYEHVHLVVKLDGHPADLTQYITLIYEVQAGPRPQYDLSAWSDRTDEEVVKTYIGQLSNRMHDKALDTMKGHCSKVDSGAAPTEKAALEKLDGRMSSVQAQSMRTALKRSQNEGKR